METTDGLEGGDAFRRKKEKSFMGESQTLNVKSRKKKDTPCLCDFIIPFRGQWQKLRKIRREVDLVADRQIQHIVRADGHRADGSGFEWVAFAGVSADLVEQLERAR